MINDYCSYKFCHTFLSAIAFWLGACIGSFLNVCIYRIPREISVGKPVRSFCPACKTKIAWYDNIPLISYFILHGKCRKCNAAISPRYFVVEFLTAVLFLLISFQYTFPPPCPLGLVPLNYPILILVYWLVAAGLILGTFIDFEHLIIPDRITIGGIITGLALSAVLPSLHNETTVLRSLLSSSIGALVGWMILWLIAIVGKMIFKKEAMGFGDVKLLAAIGAFFGTKAVLFTIFVSSLAGSIVGITLVAVSKTRMQSRIPYGPYIALAAIIWMLWGPHIWQMYVDLMLPPLPLP